MLLDRVSDPTSFVLENFIEAFRQDRPFPITNQNDSETVSTTGQLVQLNNVPLYQPLPPDSHHIRVAIISPGIWREVVQCELKLLDLSDESEQYEAISYCWGDEQDKATITINGNTVPVTKSLNDALKRLRTREKKRTVWADAICINQDDLNERQQQVELMKNIYSRATEVQVFTGESLVSSLKPAKRCCVILLWLGKDQCFHELAAEMFESPSSATWATGISILEEFLLQPWWLRVWVVQEVVLAKRATVHFGQCVFPWELLEDIYWENMASPRLRLLHSVRQHGSSPADLVDDR
ncbi:Heterokaryon incompatibility protein (HET) domain containing protein [Rhypophila sp. PSN 637]